MLKYMNKLTYFLTVILCSVLSIAAVVVEGGDPLVVSVRQGKLGAGGTTQEYRVMSGESFFIAVGEINTRPPAPVQPPNAQDLRSAQLAEQINNKVTQLQNKQREYDTELYIVQRPPIELERQAIERDLHLLEQEQEKLDAQKTLTAVQQKRIGALQAQQEPNNVPGVTVKATLMENNSVQLQFTLPKGQSSAQTSLGVWTQIPGVLPDTWVRVKLK
jgi:hypothetical protein